jgi:oleandomycin transport system ATP-binding protein
VVGELGDGPASVDRETQLVSVPVHDPAALTEAVRRFDQAGVVVAELALRRPSLDEVFLSLTGHRAEETDEGDGR